MILEGHMPDRPEMQRIEVVNGKITSINQIKSTPDNERNWISFGLVDIQINGFGGYDINSAEISSEKVELIVKCLWKRGVTFCCPTIVSGTFKHMANSIKAVRDVIDSSSLVSKSILGIHLEGPYLSSEEGPRGAHDPKVLRNPDWEEFQRFQEIANGNIGLITLAPELPAAISFIEKVVASGINVAIGHTGASAKDILKATWAGASLSTHLGNAAHYLLPRHPNYIWEQLANDELWASFIADGHHLPPSTLKCFIKSKGVSKSILVSDAVYLAGQKPGIYKQTHHKVELTPDGKIQIVGSPYLAGSALELYKGVQNVVNMSGCSLEDALKMASHNPLKFLTRNDEAGTIDIGTQANLFCFQWDTDRKQMKILETIVEGNKVSQDL